MLSRSRSVLLLLVAAACGGPSKDLPTTPAAIGQALGDGANLRLTSVQFTQSIQDAENSLPLVAGAPIAVNVLVQRSTESSDEVPVVLRLYRNGTVIREDTAHTGGILSRSINEAAPSAQFLIPASVVVGGVSWQVELDPARTVPDSTRADNVLPASAPAALNIVALPPLHVRLVSIVLGNDDDAEGHVSEANAEKYLKVLRQTMPTGTISYAIARPITTMASFGTAPTGGAPNFWMSVLQEVDVARMVSSLPSAYWYGAVTPPEGFTKYTNGGYGYIPSNPTDVGASTRSAVGFGVSEAASASFVSKTLAHELGHTFGRAHAPSCSASSPLDARFPSSNGVILLPGFDVWSWANGEARSALSVSRTTGDVMGYCTSVWSSAYTWNAVLRWRLASAGLTAQVMREPAIIVAGSVSADGEVSLRPALEATVAIPAANASGDMTVELRDDDGNVLGRQQVVSASVDHGTGARHFLAILPASAAAGARVIAATSRTGRSAAIRSTDGTPALQIRALPGGRTEVTASAGRAVMLRDANSGELLGIGWNGRVVVRHHGAVSASVSNGIRSRTNLVVLK